MAAPLAITAGEPAGIGPDLVIALAQADRSWDMVVIADSQLLSARAELLYLPLHIQPYQPDGPITRKSGQLSVMHVPMNTSCNPGILDPANAHYVLATLDRAIKGAQSGEFAAMVTGPVQKSVINDAGVAFSGHTEYLAAAADTPRVVMMLATRQMRVALMTTHLPLAKVPSAITRADLTTVIEILHRELADLYGTDAPHIGVLGLNPHAGEGGHMGREEIDTIIPVLTDLRTRGMHLSGPLPADTAFNQPMLESVDAMLAMYHDQGLPVLKYSGFGEAINITLGLPFIRTSVDHGTALDLAGTGEADSGSFHYAIEVAADLAARGKK